jgi:hypothetical protein
MADDMVLQEMADDMVEEMEEERNRRSLMTVDIDNMIQDMDSILGNIQDGIRK